MGTPPTLTRFAPFLAELARTGCAQTAARLASPGTTGPRAGYVQLARLRRRSPVLALAWEQALADYRQRLARVEQEVQAAL